MSSQVTRVFIARVNTLACKCDGEPNHALFVNCATSLPQPNRSVRGGARPPPCAADDDPLVMLARPVARRIGRTVAAGGSMQRSSARKIQLDNSFRRSSLRPAGRPQISRSAGATRVPSLVHKGGSRLNSCAPTDFRLPSCRRAGFDVGRGADPHRSCGRLADIPDANLPEIVRPSAFAMGTARGSNVRWTAQISAAAR